MRPRRLVLEGFGPYKRRQELDFTQLDLFAICGPTGAGKSSIVDALTYALYGRIYRVGDDVKAFISLDQGTDRPRMLVALEFEVGNGVYRVVRTTGERSPAQTQLEELRDGEWQPLENRVAQVNARIARLVGLDFDAFTKSVVLPQNEFHRFLSGKPEERRQILDQLLSLGLFSRLQQRASQEQRRCEDKATTIRQQLETTYADATPEQAKELRRSLTEARTSLSEKEALCHRLQTGLDLADELVRAGHSRAEAERRREEAQSRVATLSQELEQAENELAPLREKLESIERELAGLVYNPTEHQRLIKAESFAAAVARAREEERQWQEQVAKGEAKLAQDEASERAAGEAAERAEREMRAAREALEDARRHDLAATLRSGLKPGDPCPVCGQRIERFPEVAASHLTAAQRALQQAEEAAKRARAAYEAASRQTAQTRHRLDTDRERLAEVIEQAQCEQARLAELLGPERAAVVDPEDLRQELEAQERLRAEQERLTKHRAEAERELNEREKRLEGAKGQLAEARQALTRAEHDVRSATAAVENARERVSAWIDQAGRDDLKSILNDEGELQRRLKTDLDEARNDRGELQVQVATLETRASAIDEAIAQAKRLREEERALASRARLAAELAYHLRADRLPAFIREEALRALAADGSERLSFLSGGRYTLDVEKQEFAVVDHWNAGEQRSVKTLSGGETFLASLALALALAERIPELAAGQDTKLESLFLDEGFGALDAETLEVAGRALDALRSEERLVGVITHVEELAERLPARVRVVKEPDGSRLEVT